MRCHNCGSEVPEDAAFCAQCGAKVENDLPSNKQRNILMALIAAIIVLLVAIAAALSGGFGGVGATSSGNASGADASAQKIVVVVPVDAPGLVLEDHAPVFLPVLREEDLLAPA